MSTSTGVSLKGCLAYLIAFTPAQAAGQYIHTYYLDYFFHFFKKSGRKNFFFPVEKTTCQKKLLTLVGGLMAIGLGAMAGDGSPVEAVGLVS